MVKTTKLLEDRERLNRDYWNLKEKSKEQYRIKKKEHDKYTGLLSKIRIIELKILELKKEYEKE